jgi:ribosome-associated heat shock protein Hsp15
MRIDKFLAVARILKSRSLAKTAVDSGMVYINSIRAKSAREVRPDDIIEVDIPRFYKKFRIKALPGKNMKKSEATGLYEIIEEREKELI